MRKLNIFHVKGMTLKGPGTWSVICNSLLMRKEKKFENYHSRSYVKSLLVKAFDLENFFKIV